MQLKSKMAQLNVALDRAVHDGQAARGSNSVSARLPPAAPGSAGGAAGALSSSAIESPHFDNIRVNQGSNLQLQLDLQKQVEINRRLNDLLNQKDDEISSLSSRIMELEDEVSRKKNSSPSPSNRKNSPVLKNGKVHNLVKV